MALPTIATPGYVAYPNGGRTWVACSCLALWLEVYERLLLRKGKITSRIDVWQLTGDAGASSGTHSEGGVFDLLNQTDDECIHLAREMGAPATWRRVVTPTSTWRKTHAHGVLTGCPHNSPAAYQITAQRAGYNGLGLNGRAGPDPHPDPTVYRTWREGIDWAEKQINLLEDDMPTVQELLDAPLGVNPVTKKPIDLGYSIEVARNYAVMAYLDAHQTRSDVIALNAAVKALATGSPVDLEAVKAAAREGAQIDPAALAAALAPLLTNATEGELEDALRRVFADAGTAG